MLETCHLRRRQAAGAFQQRHWNSFMHANGTDQNQTQVTAAILETIATVVAFVLFYR